MREIAGDARGFAAWQMPLLRTAVAWWGGAWLPLLFGPLTECSHCVQLWFWMLPVCPGFAPAVLCGADDVAFAVIAGLVTIALVAVTAVGMRNLGARWLWLALPICIVQTAIDFGLAFAFRQ